MTSSSLCRLRHKTQTNETGKGEKTREEELGVLLMVKDIVTGISFLKREEEDVGLVVI